MVQSSCHGMQERRCTSVLQTPQCHNQSRSVSNTDDLLDQIGYLSTLDLASGYWQIATSTPRLSSQDCVHNFLWTLWVQSNALWVNQRSRSVSMLECVLMGLNPPEGPEMVSLHKQCPSTLDEHLQHLQSVLQTSGSFTGGLEPSPPKLALPHPLVLCLNDTKFPHI